MFNLYNPLPFTTEQKKAYIAMLCYISKSDNNPDAMERNYIKKMILRLNMTQEELQNINVPTNIDEMQDTLRPITSHEMKVDLVHSLWFASSIDGVITDEEVKIIRNAARIMSLNEDIVLIINSFVLDEIGFLKHASDILETENLAL